MINAPQKVLLLLQGYFRDITYENSSLINDTQYIIQNSIRLLRCMFDLCSKKHQAENVRLILDWCKYVQNRVYKNDSPLRQFTRFSYTGYNAIRIKKKPIVGFLSEPTYEEFYNKNLSVRKFLNCHNDNERTNLMGLKKRHPKLL